MRKMVTRMTQIEFISKVAPAAVEDMRKHGVPASLTIAQAILESGWGTSELATKANNLLVSKDMVLLVATTQYLQSTMKIRRRSKKALISKGTIAGMKVSEITHSFCLNRYTPRF